MTASTERAPGGASAQARLVDLASGATPAEWMALSVGAHWNQTEDDWRTMLALGRGWGLRGGDAQGRDTLVGSTLVLPYGAAFAWISMVLVRPECRGQGHAQRLLRVALDELAVRQLLPVLDATPLGRPVYLKQGFADGWGFTRWRLAGGRSPAARAQGLRGAVARPRREADWGDIEALDAPAFGASRLPLLRSLAARWPGAGWVVEGPSGLRGHALARVGRTAVQLGPLVAADDEAAMALLHAALPAVVAAAQASGRDVVADLHDEREAAAAHLRAQGFAAERPFTRMVLAEGASAHLPGDPARVVLVAGPELG